MKQFFFLLVFYIAFLQVFQAQNPNESIIKRVYTTQKLPENETLAIDGLLDEPSWDVAEWQGDFIEFMPDENTAPTYQTKFKVLYDDKFLYIGFRAYDDEPDKIERRLGRRDDFDGDWVEVNIDSYRDLRTGFSFTISASGVKGDEFISENGNEWDGSWNPIWYTKSNIDEEGWTAEMKIPFSQLRFGDAKEQVWGFQIQRRFFRKAERSLWQRKPQDAPGWVSNFGELRGLIDLKPQHQLEIQPFTVTQQDIYPKEIGNPFRDGDDFKFNAGLDAKIGITNDLTLDLTVNPDFGQVEADPAAIALDGFEIFFREQRPFFIENKNIFDFQFANGQDNLFFSRRIGRTPQGSITTGNDSYIDSPLNTTILGAAKFSGKTKNGWSIGVLESLTDRETATINENGQRRDAIVEPLTNYLVVRAQKDFNERNSFIGGIFTATNRNLGDGLSFEYDESIDVYTNSDTGEIVNPFTIGSRENNLSQLRKSAYTGGLDFIHQWKDRTYYIEGNVIASHITGSKEAIEITQESLTHLFNRVDADHVKVDSNRTSLTGTGGKFEYGKAGSGNWRYAIGGNWRSPELELNDVGFLRQADEIRQYGQINYRTLKPVGNYRSIRWRFSMFTSFDFEGNYNRIQYQTKGNFTWNNNWRAEIELGHKPRIYSNTFLRGGPRWRFSNENFVQLSLNSDRRKKLSFGLDYTYSAGDDNSFSFISYEARLRYQPLDAFNISLNTNFRLSPSKTQYVSNQEFGDINKYITGEIDQQTLSTSIRLNYTINPNLTIQYYGQPFISRGRYKNFNYVSNATAEDLSQRVTLYNDEQISFDEINGLYNIDEDINGVVDYQFDNPDFAFVQFRSNLVVRWEYIPGSELFFVWSQGINGDGNPDEHLFRGLEDQILGEKKDNTFLIKATYRFVL